jgi:hypothetical protein
MEISLRLGARDIPARTAEMRIYPIRWGIGQVPHVF